MQRPREHRLYVLGLIVWLRQKEQGREEELIVERTRGQRSRSLQVTVNKLLFTVSEGKPLKGFEQKNNMI